MLRRPLLALLVTVVALLLAEGAVSLLAGRPLLGARRAAPVGPVLHGDAERLALSRLTEGIYRYHPDPLVGVVLKPGEGQLTLGAPFGADELGVRARPGGPAPEGALRVVVLGDSVAFGFGLRDDETIAAQLEALLAAARGERARPVACLTVGAPGWNHANAVRFLEDHWGALDPDVVVYLPVENDLTDTFAVTEGGHRRSAVDVSQRDPRLSVQAEAGIAYLGEIQRAIADGRIDVASLADAGLGPPALTTDLSPESTLRFDANAADIERLVALCARNDAHCAVLWFQQVDYAGGYAPVLRERLLDLGLDALEILGFQEPSQTFRLPANPHPDADGARALARWTAEALLARGWIDGGAGRPLPAAPDGADAERAPERSPDAIRADAARARSLATDLLQRTIDTATGQGTSQIYGGINPDGSTGTRLLALLPAGSTLGVRARAEPGGEHLGDLTLTVLVDGRHAGELVLPPDGTPVQRAFGLGSRPVADAPIEVSLVADAWFAETFRGRTQLASCRVLELSVR